MKIKLSLEVLIYYSSNSLGLCRNVTPPEIKSVSYYKILSDT